MQLGLPRITDAKDYIITALILVFAISLIITRHDGGLHSARTVSVTILSYLEKPLSVIRTYRQALNTNTYLHRQNALLQDELSRLRSVEEQNRILRELLDLREESEISLHPVRIVAKELTGMNNSITVNAGEINGIKAGMPLINSDGLVGRVIFTTRSHSQVMPYINSLFRVSARIQGSRALGIVTWEGTRSDELLMQHVAQTIEVEPGQIVETSGYSNQYPPGIPIGYVSHTEPLEGVETQLIWIRPFVNLHTLAEGFIMHFQPDPAIEELMQQQEEIF